MKIRKYFDENCISIRAWAKKHDLDERTTYMVINGELTGKINTNGNTRAVFETLLAEKIISELPSGLKNGDKKAS